MRLQIAKNGYVRLSQNDHPKYAGVIVVACDDSIHDVVAPIVKQCGGHWRSQNDAWNVHSAKAVALFEALHELHCAYHGIQNER